MTAVHIIVITCNGRGGAGCPENASSRVAADNPTYARRVLRDCGWDYTRHTNEYSNIRHFDLCPACGGRGI